MSKETKQPAGKQKRKTQGQLIWHQFKKNKGAVVGLIAFLAIVGLAIIALFIVDYDTQIAGMLIKQKLQKPSSAHIFGTDHLGRDVFLRVIYGAHYSLLIGFLGTGVSVLFGTLIGAIAGYFGGKLEWFIMRLVDVLMTIPTMLMATCVVAAFGISISNLILAIGISTAPHFARTARASVMTVRGNEYVEAAKAIGTNDFIIMFKHVMPNALSPIIVQATNRVATCIIAAASFSFLGLGVPSPLPEWGAMLSDAKPYMLTQPYLMIFPGLAIMITVLALNLIGDGLRDALDPKLKR